jgi:endonuclease/exonuclease/phosphatase family metal-dependent hydrolase
MLRPIVLLVVLLAALPAASGAEERPLRLVTFNVLHGGPWAAFTGDDAHLATRLAMIVERLRALDPDVVALQESPVTRRRGDVAAHIATALGFHHVHVRATERVFPLRLLGRLVTGVLGFVEGPAVLSRFPIVASEVHDLPRCRRWLDPRVVLRADVQAPAGRLAVFSTHTSRDDCQTRRVAELARAAGGPAVVMGDLNTAEGAPVLDAFLDHGFVDLFRAAHPRAPGPTVWQRIHAPASTVFRRVDYVLLRAGAGFAAEVLGSRVVLNTPGRRQDGAVLWPSDHYGVLAEVRLRPVTLKAVTGREKPLSDSSPAGSASISSSSVP